MTPAPGELGVVVCPQVVAAEAGVQILRQGGNAVDAAIAAGFVQAVVDPPMAGLGGFGVMLMRSGSDGTVTGLDFHARAGAKTRADQWAHLAGSGFDDRYGYFVEGLLNDVGYQSVGIPGLIAGFGAAYDRGGSLPWNVLLESAIRVAAEGFIVTQGVRDFWGEPGAGGRADGYDRMTATPASAELFAPGGQLLDAGSRCVQTELARTLEAIAAGGHREFYEGEVARAIAEDFAANGGHVTLEDLASYRANEFEPICTGYRGYSVYGAPPPSGGVMLAQILRILERFDLPDLGHNTPASVATFAAAMIHAVRTRAQLGDDPDFTALDLEALLADSMVDDVMSEIDRGGLMTGALPGAHESSNTTHVTVVDRQGNAASLTHSLGYGSGVVTPGLGFMYNNYMNVFNPVPGFVDSIAPGKRRGSAMAPTMITDASGELQLVVGAPGATRITTAILHSIVNVIDYGLSPLEAVAGPRVDCQGPVIEAEGRITSDTVHALKAQGHRVNHRPRNYDPYFARAQLAVRTAKGWQGASDPRRDGGIALYA